jgi:hypothetical protein
MLNKSRVAVSALLALGVAGALAGPWAAPASAASGQVCYFGECRASSAPAASTQSKSRELARHGSWSAFAIGQGAVVVDEFKGGAKFAIVAFPSGSFGLLLANPQWRLQAGQRIEMSITIDGHAYKGQAVVNKDGMLEVDGVSRDLLKALYRGRQGHIEAANYRFNLANLADAAAAIDAAIAHVKTASR